MGQFPGGFDVHLVAGGAERQHEWADRFCAVQGAGLGDESAVGGVSLSSLDARAVIPAAVVHLEYQPLADVQGGLPQKPLASRLVQQKQGARHAGIGGEAVRRLAALVGALSTHHFVPECAFVGLGVCALPQHLAVGGNTGRAAAHEARHVRVRVDPVPFP